MASVMDVLVLGCSGSIGGPDSPASGYLVRAGGTPDDAGTAGDGNAPGPAESAPAGSAAVESSRAAGPKPVILDFGPGCLGALQRVPGVNPAECDIVLSHLHADHCLDVPSLVVWRRFHPTMAAQRVNTLVGPSTSAQHLGVAGGDHPNHPDDLGDTLDVRAFPPGPAGPFDAGTWPYVEIGGMRLYALPAVHSTEAYITRFEDSRGASLVYSGDTAITPDLARIAAGADVLLCEATWGENAEGKPDGMHLSGEDAGQAAAEAGVGRLVLTHIPPWGDAEGALRGARRYFDGEISVARAGERIRVGEA